MMKSRKPIGFGRPPSPLRRNLQQHQQRRRCSCRLMVVCMTVVAVCHSAYVVLYTFLTNKQRLTFMSSSLEEVPVLSSACVTPTTPRPSESGLEAFQRLSLFRANSSNDRQTQLDHILDEEAQENRIQQQEKKMSIAVFLQVGYAELWNDMLSCAANVATAAALQPHQYDKVDVLVSRVPADDIFHNHSTTTTTTSRQLLSSEAMRTDLEQLNHVGQVLVHEFENRGADVGAFLRMLSIQDVSTRPYDVILKMHTKGDAVWRRHATESLCGTPEQVASALHHFVANPRLDLIAPQGLLFGPDTPVSQIHSHLRLKYKMQGPPVETFDKATRDQMRRVHRQLFPTTAAEGSTGTAGIHKRHLLICAGTMFWMRYSALHAPQLVQQLPAWDHEFTVAGKVENLALEHVLERLLATEIAVRGRQMGQMAPAPRVLAMYFPQYHRVVENDRFWGQGFTEWTLLKPLQHLKQPLPVSEGGLGYYNLLSKETRRKQADMARRAGINGFVYYHYWFSGSHAPPHHKVMHQVTEKVLLDGEPNLPFCLSWANEPWTRRWTGTNGDQGKDETLLSQEYGNEEEWREHFDYLLPFFRHPNYITVQGNKPVFLIYRVGHFGVHLAPMMDLWRQWAVEAGLGGLHIVNTVGNFRKLDSHTPLVERQARLDAAFHFWPQLFGSGLTPSTALRSAGGSISDIQETGLGKAYSTQYWGSYTGFDRRPRDSSAYPYLRSPEQFAKGLYCSFLGMTDDETGLSRDLKGPNLYFVTAWNEWNEQAVLEPDRDSQFGYLQAVQAQLSHMPLSAVFPPPLREQDAEQRAAVLAQCPSQ